VHLWERATHRDGERSDADADVEKTRALPVEPRAETIEGRSDAVDASPCACRTARSVWRQPSTAAPAGASALEESRKATACISCERMSPLSDAQSGALENGIAPSASR
jgi:hypothetical protein